MPITPLNDFIRDSDALIKFGTNFNNIRDELLTVFKLDIHATEIKLLWDKVKSTYNKCLEHLYGSKTTHSDEIEIVDTKYQTTFEAYVSCLSTINEKIHIFKTKSISTEQSSAANDNLCHNLTLPPCDIDIFNGDFISWPTFRDLFTAVYINNSRLSNIERLCHLVRQTSGEAREIVSKFPLTNQGFDIAWQNLSDTYNNPRMLVNNQLKSLFSLPFLIEETSADLKYLQRGINSCLSAMSMYDISTTSWDPIIVFICIQRLPASTVCLWEQSVKDKSALSFWKDLDLFLTERIQTLDCLRDLKGTESDNFNEPKSTVHFTNATSANKSCVLCPNQGHFLHVCRRFKNLSISDRYSIVKKFNCCVNCLSETHMAENCNSIYSCSICNQRHHTLIHLEFENSTRVNSSNGEAANAVTASQPTNFTPENSPLPSSFSNNTPHSSNSQVFHTSKNSSVILGTAMVNLIHQGTTYQARALIDPASEASFISERLQRRLKLSTNFTTTEISGVNQAVSATSTKFCSLKIGSPIDPSLKLNATAFVLPKISGNLPSFYMNNDVRNISSNLRLADSNPFDSRPIDILLGADLYPKILLGGTHQNILGSLLAQNTVFGWILTGPLLPSQVRVHSTNVNFLNSIPPFPPNPNLRHGITSSFSRSTNDSGKHHRLDPKTLKPPNNLIEGSFQCNSLKTSRENISLNDFVVIKQSHLPPTSWNIGQIVNVYTAVDGRVNFADIKVKNRILKRYINQLIKLIN